MKHNKDGILLNGMYFLWEHGYYNSGINDILKSCNIPKGSFYNHFTSKEDFCIEALDLYCNIMHTSMDEYLNDRSFLPFERLKNFYINQIELSIEGDLIKGCMLCNLCLEVGSNSKKLRKELTKHLNTNLAHLEKCMTEAENKGMLIEDMTSTSAAGFIQNNWFGALLKTKGMGKVDPVNEFLENTFTIFEFKE